MKQINMIEKKLPRPGVTGFVLSLTIWLMMGFAAGRIAQAGTFDDKNNRKNLSLTILTEKSLPAVVSISVTESPDLDATIGKTSPKDKTKPSSKKAIKALGSGFIIDKSGIIVTNHHVIAQAGTSSADQRESDDETIIVTLSNHQKYHAKLIGSDELADLALLKIEAKSSLPFLRIGDSDLVKVGDWVMAVGNPFGLDGTVTVGILSAKRSYIESGGETNLLQTDAPIDHGNSGGPMLNMAGEVVGINSSIFANEMGQSVRIGFAIPSNDAQPILAHLRQFGRVKRGSLGLSLQRLEPEIAGNFIPNDKPANGVIVSLIDSQAAAAAKTGLQSGDVISHFQGRPVSDPDELARAIRHAEVGQNVVLDIWRQKQNQSVKLMVNELPKDQVIPPEMAMRDGKDQDDEDDEEEEDGEENGQGDSQDDEDGGDAGADQALLQFQSLNNI